MLKRRGVLAAVVALMTLTWPVHAQTEVRTLIDATLSVNPPDEEGLSMAQRGAYVQTIAVKTTLRPD